MNIGSVWGSGNKIDSYCCPCCIWASHRNVISYLYEILICGRPRALLHRVVCGRSSSADSVSPALKREPSCLGPCQKHSVKSNQFGWDASSHIWACNDLNERERSSVLRIEVAFICTMSSVCYFPPWRASCEITSFHYAVSTHGVVFILSGGKRLHQTF